MPRKISNALTPLFVTNAKAGRHVDGMGLQLLVKASGARSWVLRYFVEGKAREMGLGPASGPGAISLKAARESAEAVRLKVKRGVDPLAERQMADEAALAERRKEAETAIATEVASKAAAMTFKVCAEAYIASHEASWRNNKHRAQWSSTLATYVYPVMGDLPVADVDTPHVMAALLPIWHTKPETAGRVRGRIECILDAAKVMKHRSGENPARWRGNLESALPRLKRLSRGHHAAMPYREVPAFIVELRKLEAVAALALEFTILTVARTGEVLGATWDEIDLDQAVWTIPAHRMKAGKAHAVPLVPRAVAILDAVKPFGSANVFAGNKGRALSAMAMAMLLRRMDLDCTVHGMRSAFKDWASDETSFADAVSEACLAHGDPDKVRAAYRRTDFFALRRDLMAAWAGYVCRRENVVVPISGRSVA